MIDNLASSGARRAIGLVIACLLSGQATGILAGISRAPSCCCLRMQAEKKRCPVCAHAKEIESGQSFLKTCGLHEATSLPVALVSPVLPPVLAEQAAVAKQPLPADETPPLAPAPSLEVPTPPPLA